MRRAIYRAIQGAIEFGLTRKWVNEFLPGEFTLPQSVVKKESQAVRNMLRPLTVQHIVTTVLFYSVVISMACIAFVLESRKNGSIRPFHLQVKTSWFLKYTLAISCTSNGNPMADKT